MLARRAGLLDWDRRTLPWGVLAVVLALAVGSVAQRNVDKQVQAADTVTTTVVEPA